MKKTNLAITGCMGRMGQQIIKSVKKDKNFKLVTITESKKIDKKINGIKIDLNTDILIRIELASTSQLTTKLPA